MHKAKSMRKWSSHFAAEELDWSPDFNPQHLLDERECQPQARLMLLWLKGSKSLQPGFKILWKTLPEE